MTFLSFVALILFAINACHCLLPQYNVLLKKIAQNGANHYCGAPPGVQATKRSPNPNVKQVVAVMRHGDRTSFGWYHPPK
jgi:hypothetical protein